MLYAWSTCYARRRDRTSSWQPNAARLTEAREKVVEHWKRRQPCSRASARLPAER